MREVKAKRVKNMQGISYKFWPLAAGLMALCLALVPTNLQAQSISFSEVLSAVYAKHPDLQMTNLQIQMRKAESEGIDGALETRYGASAGISDEKSPATNAFSPGGTSVAFLSGQVSQPFSDGSQLTGTLNYNRAELSYPSTVPANFQSTPNPVFKHQIDLIYRYPLAKGAGNPSYQFQKEASLQDIQAAQWQVRMVKEQLANQSIGVYFQIKLDDLSLRLAKDAMKRANDLLAYQKQRESFGLIEKADRLQTEALVAARKSQLTQAKAARDMAQTNLNRLMYQDGNNALEPQSDVVSIQRTSHEDMLKRVQFNRPVFKMLDAQYAAAESRLNIAKDADAYQLDVVGQIGSRALEGSGGAALGQGFTLDDRYVALKVEFSDSWQHTSGAAAIQRQLLALESINLERSKMVENFATDIATISDMQRSGELTLRALQQQVIAERKKFEAESKRYQEGRGSTVTAIQFEGDLRAAELRTVIQKVALDQAAFRLALTLGELAEVNALNNQPAAMEAAQGEK